MRMKGPRIAINAEAGCGCYQCRDVCPMGVKIVMPLTGAIRSDDCILCSNRIDTCASGALRHTIAP